MGINKLWLSDKQFARSIERQIDRETLVDLLGIVVYEADRSAMLEDAGFADQASSVECLFAVTIHRPFRYTYAKPYQV